MRFLDRTNMREYEGRVDRAGDWWFIVYGEIPFGPFWCKDGLGKNLLPLDREACAAVNMVQQKNAA